MFVYIKLNSKYKNDEFCLSFFFYTVFMERGKTI